MRQVYTLVVALLLTAAAVQAQSYRGAVNEGNDRYERKQYDKARDSYRSAATVEPDRPESYFNAGNAAYRSDDVKAALEQYEKAGFRVRDKETLARTLYNAGNTFLNAAEKGVDNPALQQAAGEQAGNLQMEGYKQAIELYKKSLKLDPHDEDARYNLTYARKKLEDLRKQQQNQKQDQKKNQQQKQDKNEDQQNKDKQDQQQKKDKQDQQQQKQDQKDNEQKEQAKKNEQQQQPKPEKQQNMSKQQAEQILRALQRDERDLQKKKRQQQSGRVSVEKDW